MTTAKQGLLTADDLLRLYSEGVKGELIRGVLHETVAGGWRTWRYCGCLNQRGSGVCSSPPLGAGWRHRQRYTAGA